jgi:hypothetical protein
MQTKQMIVIGVVVVVVGVGGFCVGRVSAPNSQSDRFAQYGAGMTGSQRPSSGQPGTENRTSGMTRYRPVSGDIIERSKDSITVKLTDGSSKIILFSAKTDINKAQKADLPDLKVGEKVMVTGQENSDGSITAQNIQLNPIFRGQMGLTTTPTQ